MKPKLLLLALLLGGTLQAQKILEYRNSDYELVDTYEEATWIKTYEKVVLDSVNPSEHYVQIANKEGFVWKKYWYSAKKMKMEQMVDSKLFHSNGALDFHRIHHKGKTKSTYMYYEDGTLKRKQFYKKGKFQEGYCYSPEGEPIEFYVYKVNPQFPGGRTELVEYLKSEIDVDGFRRSLKPGARCVVQMEISSEGKVGGIKLLQSSGNKALDVEIIVHLSNGPDWVPGKIDKEAVEFKYYTFPIKLN